MTRALFLCTHNRLRSPTAEQVFASWPGIETDSTGLGADADVPLAPEQLDWAEIVFVMEKKHKARLSSGFRAPNKTVRARRSAEDSTRVRQGAATPPWRFC